MIKMLPLEHGPFIRVEMPKERMRMSRTSRWSCLMKTVDARDRPRHLKLEIMFALEDIGPISRRVLREWLFPKDQFSDKRRDDSSDKESINFIFSERGLHRFVAMRQHLRYIHLSPFSFRGRSKLVKAIDDAIQVLAVVKGVHGNKIIHLAELSYCIAQNKFPSVPRNLVIWPTYG